VTEATVDDATTGIGVVEPLDADISRVTADAAHDTIAFYETATAQGVTVVVPPSKTARVLEGNHGRARGIVPSIRYEDRPPSAEEGGWDHRSWSSHALSRRARDRSGDRVQHPQSDDWGLDGQRRTPRVVEMSLGWDRYGPSSDSCTNAASAPPVDAFRTDAVLRRGSLLTLAGTTSLPT
jgi:hypothetical protein